MPKADLPSYAIAAAIGALVLTIAGYLVYAAPGDAVGFAIWIKHPVKFSGAAWALLGAIIGAGLYRVARR